MSAGRYRIQAVSKATGISTATLRSWERRYGVPTPARTQSSYRLYSDHDVAMLERMRDLCSEGMSPAEAAEEVKVSLSVPTAAAVDAQGDPMELLQQQLVQAVQQLDTQAIERIIRHAAVLGPAALVMDELLVPVLREVGQLWHDGKLSVGHEHLLSEAVARYVREALHLVQPGAGAPMVLLACAAEEQHSLPLYLVAFQFASWGYRTVMLGSATPPGAVEAAVKELEPDLVGLSVTLPMSTELGERLMQMYAKAIGKRPWIVGGSGVNGLRDIIVAAGGMVASQQPRQLRQEVKQAMSMARKRRGARRSA